MHRTSTAGGGGHQSGNEYDALADLFLSGSPLSGGAGKPIIDMPAMHAGMHPTVHEGGPALKLATTPSPRHQMGRSVRIEALLVGHTPGLGAAWVTQYARHEAEATHQPVALLRTQAGRLSLEVFGLPGMHDAQPATLADALKAAKDLAPRMLVRVDEVDETELLTHPALREVTMLTGADDPAVVACYRSMKQVRGLLEQRAEKADEPVSARLAIVGTAASKAEAAQEKLKRAAEAFLSHELSPAVHLEKIQSGARPFVLFYGEAAQTTTQLLNLIARIGGLGHVLEPVRASAQATAGPQGMQTGVAMMAGPQPEVGAVGRAFVTSAQTPQQRPRPHVLRRTPLRPIMGRRTWLRASRGSQRWTRTARTQRTCALHWTQWGGCTC